MNAIEHTARELRNRIDIQHAREVSRQLGCKVVILRRVQRRSPSGAFIGVQECVYGMPAEFIEHAQSLGLLAEAI